MYRGGMWLLPLWVIVMGRATEFFHYLNQKTVDKEDDMLYTNLTIDKEVKKLRKNYWHFKKTGLKTKDDGSFTLF